MSVIPFRRGGGGSEPAPASGKMLVVPFKSHLASISSWVNMPAALTEFPGSTSRTKVDLTDFTEARLVVDVPTTIGFAGSVATVQYFDGAAWQYLDDVSGPACPLDVATVNASAWVTLAAGARADVQLRLAGRDGNGSADPTFGQVQLQLR